MNIFAMIRINGEIHMRPFNDCILPTMLKPRRNKAVAENAFPRFFKKLSIVLGISA
jgi:hypothetical protein